MCIGNTESSGCINKRLNYECLVCHEREVNLAVFCCQYALCNIDQTFTLQTHTTYAESSVSQLLKRPRSDV